MEIIKADQILRLDQKLNWEQAIDKVGKLLVESKYTENKYTSRMKEAIKEFGPYIVIAPGIGIAHSSPGPDVLKDGLVLMINQQPIFFNSHNDPVHLLFGLAAKNSDKHLESLSLIANVLADEGLVDKVLKAKSLKDISKLFRVDINE
jgi:PTS system ascorbate-specific IIA component